MYEAVRQDIDIGINSGGGKISIEFSQDKPVVEARLPGAKAVLTACLQAAPGKLSVQIESEQRSLDVHLMAGIAVDVNHPDYSGPYEVTPRVESQSIETRGKAMTQDVTILAIPIYEVSNEYGTTINIGG